LAHPQFDVSHVAMAVRGVPDAGLRQRRQIATTIEWEAASDTVRTGHAQVELKGADSALTMLIIGSSTVRRQWFIDPQKSRNNRFQAVQHFDKELRMLRDAVLVSADGSRFERGIAVLAFLLGFTPCMPMETDAPDLIVATPSGRLVLFECTTRIADFHKKLGNLVHRRGSLSKAIGTSGASAITAVLVCRLPSDQIGSRSAELIRDGVLLVSQDDLLVAFDRLQLPNDPDQMLEQALKRLAGEGKQTELSL
jgi:hypothetical protein